MKSQKSAGVVVAPPKETDVVNALVAHSMVLILTGLLTIWASQYAAEALVLTLSLALLAYLLSLLIVIDIKHGILPHMLTGTLFLLGVALAPGLGHSYLDAALGGGVAFAGLLLCAFITQMLTGKEALGGGDLWLVLGLGAWAGVGGLPMLLVATAVTGGFSVWLKRWLTQGYPVLTEGEANRFAFGPALCAAGWLAVLYGDWYWWVMDLLTVSAV